MSKSMCGRGRRARARAGWRVWDLGNGTIILQKAICEKTLQCVRLESSVNGLLENSKQCCQNVSKAFIESCQSLLYISLHIITKTELGDLYTDQRIKEIQMQCGTLPHSNDIFILAQAKAHSVIVPYKEPL